MKHLNLCIFSLGVLIGGFAQASPRIEIKLDKDDCVRGGISMDVKVRVDDEDFNFDPSCNFSFDQNFTTAKGVDCKVAAGMCSAFSPHNKFEVKCDTNTESLNIDCPREKRR